MKKPEPTITLPQYDFMNCLLWLEQEKVVTGDEAEEFRMEVLGHWCSGNDSSFMLRESYYSENENIAAVTKVADSMFHNFGVCEDGSDEKEINFWMSW